MTLFISLLAWASTPVFADTWLVYREASEKVAGRLAVALKGHQIAFLRGTPGEETAEAIYDKDHQAVFFLNHGDRLYTVISREWAKEMRKRLEETSRRMAEDMKKQAAAMPPDLKPFYLQAQAFSPWMSMFLQSATAPGAGQPRQYVPGTGSRTHGGFRCRPGELRQAGKKLMDLCLSETDAIGVPENDAAVFRQMQTDTREMYKLGAFMFGFTPPGPARIGPEAAGLAVQFRDVAGRGPETTLESVSTDEIPGGLFELPPEYLQAIIPLPGPFN